MCGTLSKVLANNPMNSFRRPYFALFTVSALCATSAMTGCAVYDPTLLRSPNDVMNVVDMGGPPPDVQAPDVMEVDVPNPMPDVVVDVPTSDDADVMEVDVPSNPCPMGQTSCGGVCVNTLNNIAHCGRCNVACPTVTNGTPSCVMGACTPQCNAAFAPYDQRTCIPPLTEPCPAGGTPPAIIQPNTPHVRTGTLTGRQANLPFSTPMCTPMTVAGVDEVYALSTPVTAAFRAELYTEGYDAAIAARLNTCGVAGGTDQCNNGVARAGRESLTIPSVTAGSTAFVIPKATGGVTGPYALVVTPTSACSNRVLDAGEECDDGNIDDNDGCSASCRVTATLSESCDVAMVQPLVASYGTEQYRLNLVGARDNIQLPCNPVRSPETVVYLRARASGKLRVQSRDGIVGIYPTNCSMAMMPSACGTMLAPAEQLSVTAGSTYALVLEPRVMGARTVDLTVDLALCGNGNIETSYGEGCDDGNMVNGDGCSSTCIREAMCNVTWPGPMSAATYADPARPPFSRCGIVPFTGMITGNNPMATTSSVTLVTLQQGDIVTATISRVAGMVGTFGVEILNGVMNGSTTTACTVGANALNCVASAGGVNQVTWASPLGGSYYIRFFTNTVMGSDFQGSITVTKAPRP